MLCHEWIAPSHGRRPMPCLPTVVNATFNSTTFSERPLMIVPLTNMENLWHVIHHVLPAFMLLNAHNTTNPIVRYYHIPVGFKRGKTLAPHCELLLEALTNSTGTAPPLPQSRKAVSQFTAEESGNCYRQVFVGGPRAEFIGTRTNKVGPGQMLRLRRALYHLAPPPDLPALTGLRVVVIERTGRRRLLCQEELIKELHSRYPHDDVRVVRLESLSPREQFHLAATTDVWIAPHGQGNIWASMMPPKSYFLELCPPSLCVCGLNKQRVGFGGMALVSGIQHMAYSANCNPKSVWDDKWHHTHLNLKVGPILQLVEIGIGLVRKARNKTAYS
eukprot:TRINITY_DN86994_c0_g1_i1.p1 TRINITY_DN86994_c0_g1~~TRINITY_DN86994_c0_g1_i1.p1  ORF type:complete len:331 (+),score=21.83 TRINITY_DN86994_c0_g1_i1:223-1215(+)